MDWFKWTYFDERALLFPQHCCQGHRAAYAASRGDKRLDQRFPAAGSGGFVLHCWVKGTVNSCADSTIGSTTRCSDREVAVLYHVILIFLKISKQSLLDSTRNYSLSKESSCQPCGIRGRLPTSRRKKTLCVGDTV